MIQVGRLLATSGSNKIPEQKFSSKSLMRFQAYTHTHKHPLPLAHIIGIPKRLFNTLCPTFLFFSKTFERPSKTYLQSCLKIAAKEDRQARKVPGNGYLVLMLKGFTLCPTAWSLLGQFEIGVGTS